MKKIQKDIEKQYIKDYKRAIKLKENREFDKTIAISKKLYNHYKSNNEESLAAETLFLMAECYLDDEKVEEALPILEKILESIKIFPNDKLEAATSQRLGIVHMKLGNQEESLKSFIKSYKIYKSLNDILNQIIGLSSLGLYYKEKRDLERALDYYHKAEELSIKNEIYIEIAQIYRNLADLYLEFRDLDKIKKYIDLALSSYSNIQDPDRILAFFINLTALLGNLEDSDIEEELLYYFLEYSEENHLKGCKITILLNLGKFYLKKENYDKSEQLTLQALELASEDNIYREICIAYYNLAVIYRRTGEYGRSIEFAGKSLEFSKRFKYLKLQIDNYLVLGRINDELKNYLQSFRNYTQALNVFRTILDKISTKELRDLYQENFKELPETLEKINNLIDSGSVQPEINELKNLKEIGIEACKTANKLIEDFNNQKCKEQQEALEIKIINILKEQLKDIKKLLEKHSFTVVINDFDEALELYDSKRKAPLSLIRNVLEGLVKGIVTKVGKKPKSMIKNLEILELHEVLKSTPDNKQDIHIERTTVYKIYGILSNYGSHSTPQDSDITANIFINTLGWIHLILKRYESSL